MSDAMIAQERSIRTPNGQVLIYFDICDVVVVSGQKILHTRSDVGFKTREEAEAFIAKHR